VNKVRLKRVSLGLVAVFVVMQFFPPRQTNPVVPASKSLRAHVRIPEDVYSSLMRACGDCHSNQTYWPWYSHIAPLSWVIVDDVNQGRRQMNLDDWESQESPAKANEHLSDICTEIQRSGMPPVSYKILHRGSLLKPQEIASTCSWALRFQAGAEPKDNSPR
jgi:hypothetical protein